jgi:hypothetical protein
MQIKIFPLSFLDSFLLKKLKRKKYTYPSHSFLNQSNLYYLTKKEQTYFMLQTLYAPRIGGFIALKNEKAYSHFEPYLFIYAVFKDPQERVALYVTSCNTTIFALKLALYSNALNPLELIISHNGLKIVHQILHIAITHTFYLPLLESSYTLSLRFLSEKRRHIFSFSLKKGFKG